MSSSADLEDWRRSAPIVVLGGDGYLGWPLSVKLALKYPLRKIVIVDDLLRRRLVTSSSRSDSLLPLPEPLERIAAFERIYGQSNLSFKCFDIAAPGNELEQLIIRERPSVVYHLAQMCSAPYSMSSPDAACFTITNNEVGNMRLLWAVRNHVPDCHVVKLGSFGEYMQCGLDICEGYYYPEHGGHRATKPAPFPRQSDDIYHVSKINDSNYISVAARKWGLCITDIMQATVFGTWTPETGDHPELRTRLDYDEMFGTVLNRFLVQALIGEELTVYGTGLQRTGLMALQDSVGSLAELADPSEVPQPGQHRVINHVTEKNYCIREIADLVKSICGREGIDVRVSIDKHDPREERPSEKARYDITTQYISSHVAKTPLDQVVYQTLKMIIPFKTRVRREVVIPKTMWRAQVTDKTSVVPSSAPSSPKSSSSVEVDDSQSAPTQVALFCPEIEDEVGWTRFRSEFFSCNGQGHRINLNTGTLGALCEVIRNAAEAFYSDGYASFPLGQYARGREYYARVCQLAKEIWKTSNPGIELAVAGGASSISNLLALSIARLPKFQPHYSTHADAANAGSPKLRVLTTQHEHVGGIQAFEQLSEFEVYYLKSLDSFHREVQEIRPDVLFLSHILCTTGEIVPVEQFAAATRLVVPECILIVDVAQSLGLLPSLPLDHADVSFGSCHKWLFGPKGTGLIWTSARFRQRVGALNFGGVDFHPNSGGKGFGVPGGQDFANYARLEAALSLYGRLGQHVALARGARLAEYFRPKLQKVLESHELKYEMFLGQNASDGGNRVCSSILTVRAMNFDPYPLYAALNQVGVHIKCIKGKDIHGYGKVNLIRFSFPYYETLDRMDLALLEIDRNCRELVRGVEPFLLSSQDLLKQQVQSPTATASANKHLNLVAFI